MRIVITHVPAGSGHEKAAQALAVAFHHLKPEAELIFLNALDQADRWYRWCFTQGYLNLVQRAPILWGGLYYLTDAHALMGPVQALHRFNNAQHGRALESFLLASRPDVVVGSHFFPMEVAAHLKKTARLTSRLITVITDYLPHTLWIAPGVDGYAVGSPQAKEELLARGIRADRIRVTGIPVDPKFKRKNDRNHLKNRLGLEAERFTLLIGSGGEGVGPVVSLVKALGHVQKPIQIVVVAGKNGPLLRTLENLKPTVPHPLKVCGFVDNMDELMEASDLMITKPGGLTCAEAMTKGLPLILISAIPGQEARNLRVLTSLGTAQAVHHLKEIPPMVEDLYKNPEPLERMRKRAAELCLPEAAFQITRWATEFPPL